MSACEQCKCSCPVRTRQASELQRRSAPVHEHHSGCFGTCSGFEGELLGRINENERSGFRTFAALYKASLVRGDVAPYPIVREGFASLRDAEPAGPSPVSGVCPRH
jgi:hypothetical protein